MKKLLIYMFLGLFATMFISATPCAKHCIVQPQLTKIDLTEEVQPGDVTGFEIHPLYLFNTRF